MGPPRFLSCVKFSAFLCNSFIILTTLVYELFVVFPAIHESSILFYVNSAIQIFFCFNVLANLLACELVDTSIQSLSNRPPEDSLLHPTWHFCRKCATLVPPRAWHCDICATCILRRDHHCAFTGCCIGSKNSRYFIVFLFYAALGCLFATLHTSFYIWWLKYETYGNLKTVFKLLCPILLFWPLNWDTAFLFTYLMNFYCATLSTGFLVVNLQCVLRGATASEHRNKYFLYDLGSWRRNLETILGIKWYLVWLSPFVKSKLLHDGLECETTSENIRMAVVQD